MNDDDQSIFAILDGLRTFVVNEQDMFEETFEPTAGNWPWFRSTEGWKPLVTLIQEYVTSYVVDEMNDEKVSGILNELRIFVVREQDAYEKHGYETHGTCVWKVGRSPWFRENRGWKSLVTLI